MTGRTEVAIAVVEHDGQLLVGKRPLDKRLGGFWEFPGGKIHAGESPVVAAERECFEETGLRIEILRPLGFHAHDYPHGQLGLHFFECRLLDPSQTPRPPFQWVTRDTLALLSMPAANAEVLQQLIG